MPVDLLGQAIISRTHIDRHRDALVTECDMFYLSNSTSMAASIGEGAVGNG
jgi:hypothetical protein